jgi:hypothetical protein
MSSKVGFVDEARVVHQDVDAPPGVHGRLHYGSATISCGHAVGIGDRVATLGADLGHRRFGCATVGSAAGDR